MKSFVSYAALATLLVGCLEPVPVEQNEGDDQDITLEPAAFQTARKPYTAANGEVEIYFTRPGTQRGEEEDPEVDDAMAEAIDLAQDSIDLCLYEFNRQLVVDAALAAHARGVKVRFVGDGDEYHDEGYEALKAAGVELVLRKPRDRIMHNKFIVIDDRVVFTGSMNLSNNGTELNNNHVMRFDNPDLARLYTAEFEQMFVGASFGRKKAAVAIDRNVEVGDRIAQVYFSPRDDIDERVLKELEDADHSVYYMIFSFTHEGISQRFVELDREGVEVVGVFDKSQARSRYSADDRLAEQGVPTFIDGNENARGWAGGKLHHKVMIIDANTGSNPTVIIGSYNWSKAATRYNDENLIVLRGDEFVSPFVEEWCRVFDVAVEHPLYTNEAPDPCFNLLAPVRINEILANPEGRDGPNEWVELVNTGAASVSLEGWTLGDAANPARHVFAPGTRLQPRSSIVVHSGPDALEPWRIPASSGALGLTNNREQVTLTNSAGVVVDSMKYQGALAGLSFNRNPDGGADGDFMLHDELSATLDSSPGSMVDGSRFVGDPHLFINELLPNPSGTDAGNEFIEIVNTSRAPVSLENWSVGDAQNPNRHTFGKVTLGPAESLVLYDSGAHPGDYVTTSGTLSLNNDGDTISLYDPWGRTHDAVTYTSSSDGVSLNRSPDGDSTAALADHDTLPSALGTSSPGTRANGGIWAERLRTRVTINEFLANPAGPDTGNEFVEIVNTGTEPVDLKDWTLSDGIAVRHVFEQSRVLLPGEHVVVFDSGSHGGTLKWMLASTRSLSLNNSGDVIALTDPSGEVHDSLSYTRAVEGVSFNREPDGTADAAFELHSDLLGATGDSSPGKRANGSRWE